MDINYELYQVFYHVSSTLSFSEASKQLFISQSAVSQSIKVLEKKLNQTLFIRSTKKVQLTPEGEILLKHVEPAMNLIRLGIAFVPDFCLPAGEKELYALTLTEALPPRQLVVVHNETMPISQASREFIELLENGSKTPEAPAPETKD